MIPLIKDHCRELLSRISNIKREEDRVKRLTASEFTVFQVLGIGHFEAWTHTPFIAALLDPNGAHGQGSRFLECFVERIKKSPLKSALEKLSARGDFEFDCMSALVRREYPLRTKAHEKLGIADLHLMDGSGQEIIIENKIHARDQKDQLLRYSDSGVSSSGKLPVIVYLTLNGSEPEDPGSKTVSHRRFSYRTDILAWLGECLVIAQEIPTLRENLLQYRKTVRIITNTDNSWKMEKEITDLVTERPENIEAYFALIAARDALLSQASERFRGIVADWYRREMDPNDWRLELPEDLTSKDATIILSCDDLSRLGYAVGFNFEEKELSGLTHGFCRSGEKGRDWDLSLKDVFEAPEHFGRSEPAWESWPVWRYFPAGDVMNSEVFVKSVFSADTVKQEFEAVAERLVQVAKELIDQTNNRGGGHPEASE